MMTFLPTSYEEAAENEIAGNYTLAACTGLSVCPG